MLDETIARYGETAAAWMRHAATEEHDDWDDRQAYKRARIAARLAIRAYPELSGDEEALERARRLNAQEE